MTMHFRKSTALALVLGGAGLALAGPLLASGPGDEYNKVWQQPTLNDTGNWTQLGNAPAAPSTYEYGTPVQEPEITYGTTAPAAPVIAQTPPASDTTAPTQYEYDLAQPTVEYSSAPVTTATTAGDPDKGFDYDYEYPETEYPARQSYAPPIHEDFSTLRNYTQPPLFNQSYLPAPSYNYGCGKPRCAPPVYTPAPPVYTPPRVVHAPPRIEYRDRPVYVEKRVPVDRPVYVPRWRDRIIEKKVFVDRPVYVERKVVVNRPIYVPRPVDRPVYVNRPVPVPVPRPVPVDRPVYVERRVPVPVHIRHAVPVDRPVYVNRPVAVPVHIERRVPVDRPVYVNRPVPVPVPKPVYVERRVPVPVPVRPRVTCTVDPCGGGYGYGQGYGQGFGSGYDFGNYGGGDHGWGAGAHQGWAQGAGWGQGWGHGAGGCNQGCGYGGWQGGGYGHGGWQGAGFDQGVQHFADRIAQASARIAEGEKRGTISEREKTGVRKTLQKASNALSKARRKDGSLDDAQLGIVAASLRELEGELSEKQQNHEFAGWPHGQWFAPGGYGYGAPVAAPLAVPFAGGGFGWDGGFGYGYGGPAAPTPFGHF